MPGTTMIDIQRAADRFHTSIGWLDSWHSFNFGEHWSPDHNGFGLLLVNNDDRVAPAAGFGTHGHRDMEIVTWVLSGRLEHRDSEGNHGELFPGLAQRMSAGRGIRHLEMNPDPDHEVHFVQMWVAPDTFGIDPSYEQRDVNAALAGGGLVPIASGQGHDGAIGIHQREAALWGARLTVGSTVVLPDAAHVHLFVPVGSVMLEGAGAVLEGDAARISGGGGQRVLAGGDGAEILVWAMA